MAAAPESLCINFFGVILDESTNMFYAKDENSVIVYANQNYLSLYAPGRRASVVGSTMLEDLEAAYAEEILEEDRRAFELGRQDVVKEIIDFEGKLRILSIKKVSFANVSGQQLLLCIGTDITEQTIRERALAESNQQLANFAAIAAHDLRSPLATYIGLLDLIGMDEDNTLSEESTGYMGMMRRSAVQLTNSIAGLLSTYKASHNDSLARKDTDLNALLDEVRFNLTQTISVTQAKVLNAPLPSMDVDANLFRHLIHNLVENSIKYRRHGQEPVINFSHRQTAGLDTFVLEDNGRGISPAEEARVFRLYDQGDKQGTGVGLGLSLCKKVVEMHKGRIWVDHSYQNGCRICFTMPQAA